MSRPARDWVLDCIMWPSINNSMSFDIETALEMFGDNFELLGSSPRMFTDYSWYQDIKYNNKLNCIEQFKHKRMSLFLAGCSEIQCNSDISESLIKIFETVRDLEYKYEESYKWQYIAEIIEILNSNKLTIRNLSDEFYEIYEEIIEALQNVSSNDFSIESYPNFFKAFGRSQQYLAFEKKF